MSEMQSLAAFDTLFWVFSLIAFIFYIFDQIVGRSQRNKGGKEKDILFEEDLFKEPHETIPIEEVLEESESHESSEEKSEPFYSTENTSQTSSKYLEKEKSEKIKEMIRPEDIFSVSGKRGKTQKNKLEFLYKKYTPQQLLVLLPAIISRRVRR